MKSYIQTLQCCQGDTLYLPNPGCYNCILYNEDRSCNKLSKQEAELIIKETIKKEQSKPINEGGIKQIVINYLETKCYNKVKHVSQVEDLFRLINLVRRSTFKQVDTIPFDDLLYYEPANKDNDGYIYYKNSLLKETNEIIACKVATEILLYFAPSKKENKNAIFSSILLALYHIGILEYELKYAQLTRDNIYKDLSNSLTGLVFLTNTKIILNEEKIEYYDNFQLTHIDTHITKYIKCNSLSCNGIISYFKSGHFITLSNGIMLIQSQNEMPRHNYLNLDCTYDDFNHMVFEINTEFNSYNKVYNLIYRLHCIGPHGKLTRNEKKEYLDSLPM